MNDPKSTNDIRMIAAEVVAQRDELCEVKRQGLDDRAREGIEMARENATSIAQLTTTVATLATTVTSIDRTAKANTLNIDSNQSAIAKLKGRHTIIVALAAALGAAAPIIVDILFK